MIEIKIKEVGKSQIEITGELTAETLMGYETKALELIGKDMEIDGFRKGKVPATIVKQKIPELSVLQEMAELAMADAYPKILEENKIDAIGRPEVAIMKLAKDNPLGFKITTAVMPKIELPDYKKLAKSVPGAKEEGPITDEEVIKSIKEIQKMRAHQELHKNDKPGEENHEHAPITDSDVPELNDEYVKTFGEFKTVDEFKAKVKENLLLEQGERAKEKNRLAIIEAIIKETTIEVPDVILNAEVDKMLYRLESDLSRAGLTTEDYMKNIGKTMEQVRAELMPDAEKRAKLELIVHAIAEKENLKPDEDEVNAQVEHLLEHYQGADPINARAYIENITRNEKVFQFLESSI